jgi:UDP-N-acetylglucosamine 3-dehydrogenase
MTNQVLRAGLIGLGRMGRHHARVLRHLDGVTLTAAADPTGDPYHAADGIPVHASLDALLNAGIDYAVLACPTSQHEPLGTRLAAAGIPTLIEKPLAPDADAARRLADAFRAARVPAAVGYIERFNPALIAMRNRLADGQLGHVFQVVTRRTGPFPARITDVGVVQDLATHDLDLTAWVTGQHYTEIAARTAHLSHRPHEDLLAAVAVLDAGTIACHIVNWLSPLKERTVIATGVHGCLAADTLTADLTYWANGTSPTQWDALTTFRGVTEGDITRYAIPKKEPLLAEHQAWRDTVLGKPASITPIEHGVNAILVAETALDAARTGATRPVPMPAPAGLL